MTCKDCTERHPGCHSECETYAEFKRENEARKPAIRGWREKEAEYALFRAALKRKRGQR